MNADNSFYWTTGSNDFLNGRWLSKRDEKCLRTANHSSLHCLKIGMLVSRKKSADDLTPVMVRHSSKGTQKDKVLKRLGVEESQGIF